MRLMTPPLPADIHFVAPFSLGRHGSVTGSRSPVLGHALHADMPVGEIPVTLSTPRATDDGFDSPLETL
jgi:hypothetical protein